MENEYERLTETATPRRCIITKYQTIKLILSIIILVVLTINSIIGFGIISSDPKCIDDVFIIYTERINKFIGENLVFKYILLISSGLLQDTLFVIYGLHFIRKSETFRFFYCFLSLLLLKIIFYLSFPQEGIVNNINEFPYFPSILNDYTQNTLYFSLETSILALIMLEYRDMNELNLSWLTLIAILYAGVIKIFMRMNYSIDIIFACIFSHYAFVHWSQYSISIDNILLRLRNQNKEGISTFEEIKPI
jgi:hypothetical protein